MKTPDTSTLLIPTQAVTNPAFPHDARLDRARAFLASRGITSVRPVYGTRARAVTLNARLASAVGVPRAANDEGRSPFKVA
jgi:hypothetical protein